MADAYVAEGNQDVETPDEEVDGLEAFEHISKYCEARRALPWEQWTLREKVNYYMDRIFIGFLVIAVLIFLGEAGYKMWYVTNVKKIAAFVSDAAMWLFGWLLTQEEHEELIEL